MLRRLLLAPGVRIVLALAAPCATTACAQDAPPIVKETVIAVQQSRVAVVGHGQGTGSVVLLNVHDDESTSVEAALALVRRGGPLVGEVRLYELRHTGRRNLVVQSGTGDSVTVDPNRMFTDVGARRSLERLGRYDATAHAAIRAFADTLLTITGADSAEVLVALHNNTDANYSLRSYLPGGSDAAEAADVYLHPRRDPDDFFFVTDRALFDALRRQGFSVVLQDNARATDDGSLSVLAARRGQRYVNVEAQHGHVATQAQMLRVLLDVLPTLPPVRR